VTLLDSLLDAIIRLDGEALVMHAGEKPYVVLSSASMSTFRGPLSWGQVELSSRPLTTDAVLGMLGQMLSAEQGHVLDEFGAIEEEIDAPGESGERFVVTAARGGDDVWVEVRRRITAPSVAAPESAPQVAAESEPAHIAHPEPEGAPQPPPLIEVVAEDDVRDIALEQPAEIHEIHAIDEDLTAIVDEATGSTPIFEVASMPGFAIQTEASRVADEDEHDAEVFDIHSDTTPGTELDPESAPVFEIAQHRPAQTHDVSESEREIALDHLEVAAEHTEVQSVAQEFAAVIDGVEAGRAAAEKTGELAEQKVSELAEQRVTELAEQKVSEFAEQRVTELAEQKVSEFAEQQVNAIAEREVVRAAELRVGEIAAQRVTEVAVRQVAEIAGRRVSEIAEQRVAEIAGQSVAEAAKHQVGEVAEQRVTEVAEQKVTELAGHRVAEAAERQVAEIAAQTVMEVAGQKVGKIAEQTVAAVAEQRVGDLAGQTVADVAEQKVGSIAEQTVAAIAERRVAEIAGQTVTELAEQKIGAIAEQTVAAAVERRVAEIAEREVADVAERQVAEIAARKVTEVAEQKVAELAERTVAEVASQRVGDIAEQRVAEIAAQKVAEIAEHKFAQLAEQKFAELAEQKAAEITEQKVSAAAEQARAAESLLLGGTAAEPEFEAIPVVVPHARPAFRLHQLPPPPPSPAASEEASLVELLRAAAAARASTVYAVVETRPMMRVEGQISLVGTHPSLAAGDVERFIFEFAPRDQVENPAPEWTCAVPGIGRVRCVTFHDHSGAGLILHLPTGDASTADQLGIPEELQALCAEADGLVVVAGPRSSGKSTLLSVFVDLINRTRYDHVITIESQITKVHEKRLSFISQREVRGDGDAIAAAARAALREGPDVLVIEDLRAPEALTAALDAARAGRLVFGSISARTAPAAIERLIDAFPADRRPQVRASLAGSLRAVVAQLLVPKAAGGRTAAREVLLSSPPVRKLVLDGAIEQLPIAIESGRSLGMRTLVDSLGALVRDRIVDIADACACAPDRSALIAALERDGIDVTGVERRA